MSIFPYSTEDKLFSLLFPHVSPPFLHNSNTDGREEPGAPQLPLSFPLHCPAGFSHVHIAIALDFVTHVTAACWYHTAAPACCPPCFTSHSENKGIVSPSESLVQNARTPMDTLCMWRRQLHFCTKWSPACLKIVSLCALGGSTSWRLPPGITTDSEWNTVAAWGQTRLTAGGAGMGTSRHQILGAT